MLRAANSMKKNPQLLEIYNQDRNNIFKFACDNLPKILSEENKDMIRK